MSLIKQTSIAVISSVLALLVFVATPVNAEINPFASQVLMTHVSMDDKAEGKCGEGKAQAKEKCGEGKCGEGKAQAKGKCGEGKCGEGKAHAKGKCGEGKGKAHAKGKCGEGKAKAKGKCGEGKCGEGKAKAEDKKCGG